MHAPQPQSDDRALETIGLACAVVFPVGGLIIGIVLANRGSRYGIPTVVLSLAVIALAVVLLTA